MKDRFPGINLLWSGNSRKKWYSGYAFIWGKSNTGKGSI